MWADYQWCRNEAKFISFPVFGTSHGEGCEKTPKFKIAVDSGKCFKLSTIIFIISMTFGIDFSSFGLRWIRNNCWCSESHAMSIMWRGAGENCHKPLNFYTSKGFKKKKFKIWISRPDGHEICFVNRTIHRIIAHLLQSGLRLKKLKTIACKLCEHKLHKSMLISFRVLNFPSHWVEGSKEEIYVWNSFHVHPT